jgi:protein-disulfide isomerase
MKLRRIPAIVAAVGLLSATGLAQAPGATPPAPAQTLQQQNEEILRELRAIRTLMESVIKPQRPPQPTTGRVTNLTGHAMGRADAPLTMVEFTDLQCPYCRQFAVGTFDEIKKNWIDTGKLRYISRDFPLDFHPQAMPAARAARCAGEQGKFWEMRLALVRNANLLTADYIKKTAADLKLDATPFAACAASTKFDAEIRAEMQEGARLGIDGTPTFVVGRTTPTAVEGPMIVGALPYAEFDARLKALLK